MVENKNKEIYIIAGGNGQGELFALNNKVLVPDSVWKVVLILDKPGQGIADVTQDTLAFGLYLPNTLDYTEAGAQDKIQNTKYPWQDNFEFNGKGFGLFNVRRLEEETGYNFFSNLPTEIQNVIETRKVGDIKAKIAALNTLQAPLMTAIDEELSSSSITNIAPLGTEDNNSIGHSGIPNQIPTITDQFTSGVGTLEISISENSRFEGRKIGSAKTSTRSINIVQVSSPQISVDEPTTTNIGSTQIGIPNDSFTQITTKHENPPQIGSSQIGSNQIDLMEDSSLQVDISQNNTVKIAAWSTIFRGARAVLNQFDSSKVTFPTSIPLQQFITSNFPTSFFPSHNLNSNNLSQIQNNPLNLFDPTFNINLQITNLPTGQLAEAQINKFDQYGRPNGGTLLIDDDANGVGWFIDTTPLDNSEFAQTLTDTAFRATTGDAYGKYDLLTTIFHETGHLLGIINGNPGFDSNVQTLNGKKVFIGKDFTANLSPDGSHLDAAVHPYDLMNNTLAPGVRKLPSLLNLQIINAIRGINISDVPQRPTNPSPQPFFLPVTSTTWKSTSYQPITPSTSTSLAPLRAILLADITNGNFEETDTTKPEFGWSTRGAATILNSQAILTEDSPFNSNFTQTFIIPSHAKYLQFTILDTHLGTNEFAPNDAFEVALLDARTLTPLVGTSIGLTQTDSLLNLQQTGNAYFSDKVKIAGANTSGDKIALNTPRTVKIDISNIAPGTLATLYFDLLGFGAKDGKVIIDNVMLLDKDLISPTSLADTATTGQAKPVLINILANDSDADGTINPSTVQIGTAPHTGSIIINSDGTLTYTPNNTFVGIDTFTYIVLDNDNTISNEATVTVNINNIAPIIDRITVESNLREGTIATFSAIAIDPGDNLTYTWNFGDDSNPVTGQTLKHTFADNGTYTAILTVTDTHGASTVETLLLNVINVAPIVNPGADITTDEGTAITFNGSFIDSGIKDTHTITWDFGDGTTLEYTPHSPTPSLPSDYLNPTHTYTKDGIYTATPSVIG